MIGNEYWNVDGNLWHKDIMTAYMTVASKCQLPYEKWTEIHWSEIAGQWQEPPVRDAHAPVYAHDFMDNPPKPNRYIMPDERTCVNCGNFPHECSCEDADPTILPCPVCGETRVWQRHDIEMTPSDWFECDGCEHAWDLRTHEKIAYVGPATPKPYR